MSFFYMVGNIINPMNSPSHEMRKVLRMEYPTLNGVYCAPCWLFAVRADPFSKIRGTKAQFATGRA